MKLLYKIVLSLLVLAVIGSSALVLYYFNKVNSVYGDQDTYIFGSNPKYHYSLILNSEDEKYWQDFKEGVVEACKAYNAAIEFHSITEPDSNGQTAEYINIANKSKVDGIIVNGFNSAEYSNALKSAAESSINIVVGRVESDDTQGLYYVGTNFYEYGVQAAKLIAQAGGEKDRIKLAVIMSDQENNGTDIQSTNMMNGLKKEIENGLPIDILCEKSKTSDLLGAENLTRSILKEYPEVNVIFCTTAKDTEAAASVIVDRNLNGKVYVVGTDVTNAIKNYIKYGVVFGTLERNGRKAGYKSVEVLSKADTFQTDYFNIESEMYTKINIDQTVSKIL